MGSKKKIVFFTIFGLIPFYSSNLSFLFDFVKINYNERFLNEISFLYGALIVSFLSGMQWQKIIQEKLENFYFLPMITVIIVWTYKYDFFLYYQKFIIILCLFFLLLIDCTLLKKFNELWFRKLRFVVTFLAILSYFL